MICDSAFHDQDFSMVIKLAIIGSGPSALGVIHGLIDSLKNKTPQQRQQFQLNIFEKSAVVGAGLPYNSKITGARHLLNHTNISAAHFGKDAEEKTRCWKWMQDPQNQKLINAEFDQIFRDRLEEKFRIFFPQVECRKEDFSQAFEENYTSSTAFAKLQENLGNEPDRQKFSRLHSFYLNDRRDIQERYLNYASQRAFIPRIAYGIYAKNLFQESLQELQSLIGETNVTVHASTNVTSFNNESSKLHFENAGQEFSENFDHIFVATGRWQPDLSTPESTNYIPNAWPISRVEQKISDAIQAAKAAGEPEVTIAIEGGSLSAIDIAKTVACDCGLGSFEKDSAKTLHFVTNPDLGIAVKVDLITRNGMLNKVRGNFNPLENVGKYYLDAVKQIVANKNPDFDFSEIEKRDARKQMSELTQKLLKDQVDPETKTVPAWKVLTTMLEILATSYEQTKLDDKAAAARDAISHVTSRQNDYASLIGEFLHSRTAQPFQTLKEDLIAATQGDVNGDYIFERINDNFAAHSNYRSFLAPEDKMLLSHYRTLLNSTYYSPMPPQSAQELIALNEAGILNVVGMGFDLKRTQGEGVVTYTSSKGERNYNMAINSTGTRLNFRRTPDTLYRALYNSYTDEIETEKFKLCSAEEYEAKKFEMEKKFGEQTTASLLYHPNLTQNSNGDYEYDSGEAAFKSIPIKAGQEIPKLVILRNLVGVASSSASGREEATKIIEQILKIPEVSATKAKSTALENLVTTSHQM